MISKKRKKKHRLVRVSSYSEWQEKLFGKRKLLVDAEKEEHAMKKLKQVLEHNGR